MNQNTENLTAKRQKELECLVKETKRDKLVGYAKAVGGVIAPIAILGGIGAFCGYTFENQDLANLLSLGLGIGLGASAGPAYIEAMKDVVKDIRYASSRLREYITELQYLD